MRTLPTIGILALLPCVALTQGIPGTAVRIGTRVLWIQNRGDTLGVAYSLHVSSASRESLFIFTVEAPSPVVRIASPEPPSNWSVRTTDYDLPVASWGMLHRLLAPGSSSPSLAFWAIGVPGIVRSYATGWFRPLQEDEPMTDSEPRLSSRQLLAANAVVGQTVGVEPFPTDLSPGNLLARLRALTDSACSLGWINGRGTCRELAAHLDQANRELQRGRREEARQHLREFVRDLRERSGRRPGEKERGDEERQEREDRGAAVNSSAYWLLTVNADYLLTRLCEAGERCREDR